MNISFERYLCMYKQVIHERLKDNEDRELLKRHLFYMVKVMSLKPEVVTYDELIQDFQMYSLLKGIAGQLTPNEFINLYPITKEYDGERFGMKDYFYTIEYIDQLDRDRPIFEQVEPLEFLLEYNNKEIHQLNVDMMMSLSNLNRMKGMETPAESWARINNLDTYTKHTDNQGNEFLLGKDGKTLKIEPKQKKKRKPKHLKLVK